MTRHLLAFVCIRPLNHPQSLSSSQIFNHGHPRTPKKLAFPRHNPICGSAPFTGSVPEQAAVLKGFHLQYRCLTTYPVFRRISWARATGLYITVVGVAGLTSNVWVSKVVVKHVLFSVPKWPDRWRLVYALAVWTMLYVTLAPGGGSAVGCSTIRCSCPRNPVAKQKKVDIARTNHDRDFNSSLKVIEDEVFNHFFFAQTRQDSLQYTRGQIVRTYVILWFIYPPIFRLNTNTYRLHVPPSKLLFEFRPKLTRIIRLVALSPRTNM